MQKIEFQICDHCYQGLRDNCKFAEDVKVYNERGFWNLVHLCTKEGECQYGTKEHNSKM